MQELGVFRVKSFTKYRILRLLNEKGEMTVSEIAEALKLSRSTVHILLRYYRSQYLVKPVGAIFKEGRGRNPTVWSLTRRGEQDIQRLKRFYNF